ncbi:C-X-C motif chemokine 16 isoform X2 [Pleurodeles waltl]|uniref:C-X-C motif chemokine 16 isoform X2 n=1 Tax=Pleurodeles waltl TaxID=8319 RepID=UPI003709B43A
MASLLPAGTQGALLVCLVLQLVSTGWCQYGNFAGQCMVCNGHMKKDLSPQEMNRYAHNDLKIILCHSFIIRFQLGNNLVCGKSSEEWVKKLRDCFENQALWECKKKTTPAPAQITTTSAAAAPTTRFVFTTTTEVELTTRPTPAPKNPNFTKKVEYQTTLESMDDANNETHNDALAGGGLKDELKNSTPAPPANKMKHLTVAVISLLAVVFVLVTLVTYLICRKKAHPNEYVGVDQTVETQSTIDEAFSGN